MSYFKRDGVVIKSDSAPISCNTAELNAIVDGWKVPLKNLPVGAVIQGVLTCNTEPWDSATELEYLVYASNRVNLIEHQSRETRSLLWALNYATKTELRLGVNDPATSQSVAITTIEQKRAICSLTQHWYASNRPRESDDNSTWCYWILKQRQVQPFVFLGSVIDTTAE